MARGGYHYTGPTSMYVEMTMLGTAMACVWALCSSPVPVEAEDTVDRTLHEWHMAGLMIAAFSMVISYFDDVPVLIISAEGKSIKLDGKLRWHTLGLQNYTLVAAYFFVSFLLDAGLTLPRLLRASRVLLAVTYPLSIGYVLFYTLVLLPAYRGAGNRWAKLGLGGRPRPLIVYNSAVVLTTGEILIGRRLLAWRDMPVMVLFAIFYCSQHIEFVKKHKLCIYDVLDFRRPGAVRRHLAVLLGSCGVFALGPLVSRFLLSAPLGELASPLLLLAATLACTPLYGPKDTGGAPSAAPPPPSAPAPAPALGASKAEKED